MRRGAPPRVPLSLAFAFFRGTVPRKARANKGINEHMVKINGEEMDAAGRTVAEHIASAGFNPARVVVELNGGIVPKAAYADTVFRDGDSVEIVCFMGGG